MDLASHVIGIKRPVINRESIPFDQCQERRERNQLRIDWLWEYNEGDRCLAVWNERLGWVSVTA